VRFIAGVDITNIPVTISAIIIFLINCPLLIF